jgi:hypothetical protein
MTWCVRIQCSKRVYHNDERTLYTDSERELTGEIERDHVDDYVNTAVAGLFAEVDMGLEMVLGNHL